MSLEIEVNVNPKLELPSKHEYRKMFPMGTLTPYSVVRNFYFNEWRGWNFQSPTCLAFMDPVSFIDKAKVVFIDMVHHLQAEHVFRVISRQ